MSVPTRLSRLAGVHRLPRRTVRLRLTLLYGVLFLASGAALVAITYGLFQRATQYAQPKLPAIPHTPSIKDLHVSSLSGGRSPVAQTFPALRQLQLRIAQDQNLLARSVPRPGYVTGNVHLLATALPQLAADQRRITADQHRLTAAINQLSGAVHQVARAGSVQAAQRATDSHQLLIDAGIALAIVALLALLAGWFLAGRILRPIRTITRKAQRISSTSLHERLGLEGPEDELKELGDTLDDLLARLDAAFEAQRQFVANASHELRAPLTRQRAMIQVALADPRADRSSLRRAHERVLASERHLERMIDGLLTLTRGQTGVERREDVDLASLATEVTFGRESQLAGLGLELRTMLQPAPAAGDPRLLERLTANLIDNGIGHNAPGGYVEVVTGTRDGEAFLTVTNTGPVIPPDEVQRLFEPFQRLGAARTQHDSGHGLGLSIVRAIADAHGAALEVRARAQGGLNVDVALPPPIEIAPAHDRGSQPPASCTALTTSRHTATTR